MLLNARNCRWMHRTLNPELVEFVTLRRRLENTPVTEWPQTRWKAQSLVKTEQTDSAGGGYLTVFTNKWRLYREYPEAQQPPRVGDQLVQADGTVIELNSAVPVNHALFYNYAYEVDGVVVGVN